MTENKLLVPPLKIQGIKTKLVPLILENLPDIKDCLWVEPFMGSGVVGFNVCPKRAIFCDINPHIINFYNSIKDGRITPFGVRSFLEEAGIRLSEGGVSYYLEVRERFNEEHNPLDFLFLNRSCFNGMMRFNKNNNFNVPYGHKPERFAKAYVTKIVNQTAKVARLILQNDWDFFCQSYEETLNFASDDAFIYCDPPYIGRHVDYYDSWNEVSERRLASLLLKKETPFMFSTWDHNEFRANEYIHTIWNICRKVNGEHFYHVGASEKNRHPMTEALLMNYETVAPRPTSSVHIQQIFDFDVAVG